MYRCAPGCNVPATFQRAMQYVLSGRLWKKLSVTQRNVLFQEQVEYLGPFGESQRSNHQGLASFDHQTGASIVPGIRELSL